MAEILLMEHFQLHYINLARTLFYHLDEQINIRMQRALCIAWVMIIYI